MCGGGGGGGVSEQLALQSAGQEQQRQDRINQGMRQLEAMFNGGRITKGQLSAGTAYDPGKTYYNQDGSVWQPGDLAAYRQAKGMTAPPPAVDGSGGGDSDFITDPVTRQVTYNPVVGAQARGQAADQATQQARLFDDQTRQQMFEDAMGGGLYSGVEDVTGYGDSFYDKAYQAQLDYAMPQVDRQYADAQKSLEFALARQGLSASSQAGQLQADLARQRDLAIQGEQDKANTVRQQQRGAVEDERSSLTQMLQQTGDVESTMNAAAARKNIIDSAPAIQEVGPLFQNATGALADMIVSPSMRAASANRATSGGYGAGKGSGKVVT